MSLPPSSARDGVTLSVVDTSANYMGGNSELMVGEVVDRWRVSGGGEDKRLTVVSKFGYASVSERLLIPRKPLPFYDTCLRVDEYSLLVPFAR